MEFYYTEVKEGDQRLLITPYLCPLLSSCK